MSTTPEQVAKWRDEITEAEAAGLTAVRIDLAEFAEHLAIIERVQVLREDVFNELENFGLAVKLWTVLDRLDKALGLPEQ